jgi:hypothetical protein
LIAVGQFGQLGAERPELVVVERPAHQREPLELSHRGRDQPRVPVTEVQRGVRGEQVQVAASFNVGHPRALGLVDDDRQRVVVVRGVLLAEPPQLARAVGHGLGHSSASHLILSPG